MNIYFIIEILLFLAACVTAVTVTVKNLKLRKTIAQQERSVKGLMDTFIKDTTKIVKLEIENTELKKNLKTLASPLPERREKETDAHHNQRCRQSVVNKAAKHVMLTENEAILSVYEHR
jgi:hypothetical protein